MELQLGFFCIGRAGRGGGAFDGSVLARLVIYEDAAVAEKALAELNESELDGRKLYLRKVCFTFNSICVCGVCVCVCVCVL